MLRSYPKEKEVDLFRVAPRGRASIPRPDFSLTEGRISIQQLSRSGFDKKWIPFHQHVVLHV